MVCNEKLMAADASERDTIDQMKNKMRRIGITFIGGQDYLFCKRNQQISPAIIREGGIENIIIPAALQKVQTPRENPLRVDTEDKLLNRSLKG